MLALERCFREACECAVAARGTVAAIFPVTVMALAAAAAAAIAAAATAAAAAGAEVAATDVAEGA